MHWRRKWQPTPVLLPGKSHGWRSLVGLQSKVSLWVGHDWSDLAAVAAAASSSLAFHMMYSAYKFKKQGDNIQPWSTHFPIWNQSLQRIKRNENYLRVPENIPLLLLLLLSHFNRVRLCATPKTAAHQAPPSLGFSRQEHWSGLPFPSPKHESEKWKWSPTLCNPMDCSLPGSSVHGIFQARVLEWGAIAFSGEHSLRKCQILDVLIISKSTEKKTQTYRMGRLFVPLAFS